jgi:hypothetical protein
MVAIILQLHIILAIFLAGFIAPIAAFELAKPVDCEGSDAATEL